MSPSQPDDPFSDLPFPTSDVSNGEWAPRPPNARQRAVAKEILEQAEHHSKRLGISRRDFLRSAAGMATGFMAMNSVFGVPSRGNAAVLPVKKAQCEDPELARELFSAEFFVMDVQLHHVDLEQFGLIPSLGSLRFVFPQGATLQERLQLLSQANMVKEVFVDSETEIGVISGVPNGVPMPVETMAATRDLVNELAGSRRALMQAMIDPKAAPGSSTALDSMEHQVRDLGAKAIKTYTGAGQWFLDDEDIAYPMLEEASRLGMKVINVHKGFPDILGGGSMAETYVRSRDFPRVLRDWPKLRFVAYHSGYFPGEGIEEFLGVVRGIRKKDRRRLYAEIGSAFAVAFTQGPEAAAHLVGSLLRDVGSKRILWGTDSIWWGSPQWQIEAFKALQIPESMQEEFGYPALTEKRKKRILGQNAAKLYGRKPRKDRCTIDPDRITQIREEQGGIGAQRSQLVYGPRTREDYRALLAHNGELIA